MKNLINKILIFSILPTLLLISFGFLADGSTDPFYVRFITPKQQNLIIGTSRAAQGLQPVVFQSILNRDIYNYAFTGTHSPFGKVYYESIKRKHNKTKNGIFIIAVNPWSISSQITNPNDSLLFRENNLILDNTTIVDMKPNYQYLYKNLVDKYKYIFKLNASNFYLHNDGWLEIIDIPMDSLTVLMRINKKVKSYRDEVLPKTQFSYKRLDYLLKTVNYLKKYGDVFLVRLPLHKDIMQVEGKFMPDFNFKIKDAIEMSNGYLDMTDQNELFDYTDGNHLYKTSGEKVSVICANWIREQMLTRKHSN